MEHNTNKGIIGILVLKEKRGCSANSERKRYE